MTIQVVYSGMRNGDDPVWCKQGTKQGFGPKIPCFDKKIPVYAKRGVKNGPVWSYTGIFLSKQGKKSTKQGSREPRVNK